MTLETCDVLVSKVGKGEREGGTDQGQLCAWSFPDTSTPYHRSGNLLLEMLRVFPKLLHLGILRAQVSVAPEPRPLLRQLSSGGQGQFILCL